jgi:hypothetical protein
MKKVCCINTTERHSDEIIHVDNLDICSFCILRLCRLFTKKSLNDLPEYTSFIEKLGGEAETKLFLKQVIQTWLDEQHNPTYSTTANISSSLKEHRSG